MGQGGGARAGRVWVRQGCLVKQGALVDLLMGFPLPSPMQVVLLCAHTACAGVGGACAQDGVWASAQAIHGLADLNMAAAGGFSQKCGLEHAPTNTTGKSQQVLETTTAAVLDSVVPTVHLSKANFHNTTPPCWACLLLRQGAV